MAAVSLFNLVPRFCLSSASFVVGRKILVASGHVTTQNLGGKNICWAGGVAECFACCCVKLCGFQILKLPALSPEFEVEFCRERMLHNFCRVQNIEDFRSQRNSAAEWSSNVSTVSKCKMHFHVPNRNETNG